LVSLLVYGVLSADNGGSCDDKFKEIMETVFRREGTVALSLISRNSILMLRNQMESLSPANRNKMVIVTLDKASHMACQNMSESCVSSRQLRADCTATPAHTALHDGVVRTFKRASNPLFFFFKKNPFFLIGYLRLYFVGVALSIPDIILLVLDTDIVFDKNYDPFRFTEPYK